jgi:hypothetical protein
MTTSAATSALNLFTSFSLKKFISMNFDESELPEEELAIQVCQVNFVQIDHSDVPDARNSQVFQNFTAQPASTNHQHLAVIIQSLQDARVTLILISKVRWSF